MASYDGDLADTIGIGNIGDPVKAMLGVAADTLDVATGLTGLVGLQLFELIAVTQSELVNGKFHMVVTEAGKLQDRLLGAYTRTVADTIDLDAAIVVGRAARVIEHLELVDALLPSLAYHKTVSEAVTVSVEIARFFGAFAADGLVVTGLALGDAYKGAHVEDAISINASVTPRFVLRVDARDDIDIAAADAVRMAFNGTLADTIEITAAYIESGSVTTWAMNTRSAAVTQYENFDFNSFAKVGHKHLAASEDGLYELIGDTDDGDDIIATIRSGLYQWAGAHLMAFKAIYLAVRGEGDFVLRILTADGKVYNYAATAESMLSTKIHTGKGLRSRYFAFELVSTGQDFDLETLEFVPLVAKRRV